MAEFTAIEQAMLMKELTDQQKMMFSSQYDSVKKDSGLIVVLAVILGMSGIDRFMLGDIGMGVLKLFTFGGCGILWIIDIFSAKSRTSDFNRKNANEIYQAIKIVG